MSGLPRVLVVGTPDEEARRLSYVSKGFLDLEMEPDPMIGVNRLGIEDFDLVVVDPDVEEFPVVEVLFTWLQRNKIPYMVFRQGDTGNLKRLSASGHFNMRALNKNDFVDSVLKSIGIPA